MAYSTIQNIHKRKAEEQAKTRALVKKALATRNNTYTTGKVGQGSGQHVLVLGGDRLYRQGTGSRTGRTRL